MVMGTFCNMQTCKLLKAAERRVQHDSSLACAAVTIPLSYPRITAHRRHCHAGDEELRGQDVRRGGGPRARRGRDRGHRDRLRSGAVAGQLGAQVPVLLPLSNGTAALRLRMVASEGRRRAALHRAPRHAPGPNAAAARTGSLAGGCRRQANRRCCWGAAGGLCLRGALALHSDQSIIGLTIAQQSQHQLIKERGFGMHPPQ